MRFVVAIALLLAFGRFAEANGRPPRTSTINFKVGDETKIVAGMSFGVLVSDDNGATWRWMCEGAVGYGGMYDPDYVFAQSGTLFATTFDGLKARRDQCVFGETPNGMKFVSAITLGPDGAIYFASTDATDGKIYKSTDDGMTFPMSSMAGQLGDWYTSLEVAPSDANRLYLSGHRFVQGPTGTTKQLALFRSLDGGQTWNPLPITDFTSKPSSTLVIVGIAKTNADLVFAKVVLEDNAISDAIYRSTDGGQSWTRILGKQGAIAFLVRASGELVAGTLNQGMVHSTDNGATWQDVVDAPHVNCLVENTAGEMWACTQNFGSPQTPSDNAGIMKASSVTSWTKVMRFQEMQAPVDCPVGTAQRDMCDELWCGLCEQLGCDAQRACLDPFADAPDAGPKPSGGGCCQAGADRGGLLLAILVGTLLLRRRRLRATWVVLVLATICSVELAHANGRAPVTNGVFFRPGDNETIFVRSTFGLLVSRDAGCTFRWVCEQSIGYGGVFDPKYAVATDGTIFATTFNGLRVSRDGGCTFTTATEELPAGDPNRLVETWVDALDLSTTGDVWIATADSSRQNNIFRSTDNGVTFVPRNMLSPTILWKSLKVAPSDPQRVYVTGYELAGATGGNPKAHAFASKDGGESWDPLPLANVQLAPTPVLHVAAVDPVNPSTVYMIAVEASLATGDRLYRSSDAGVTFVEVLVTTEPIRDLVIRDATTVIVAGATGGSYQSTDGGVTFAPIVGAPELGCLGRRPDGTLVGCGTNWQPDFMAVAASPDATQWEKLFRFVELAGPLQCPAGTPQAETCGPIWPGLQEMFGVKGPICGAPPYDGAEPPGKSGGCCDAGDGAPFGVVSFSLVWLVFGRRRARRAIAPH